MKIDVQALWQAVKNVSVYSKKDGWAQAVKVVARYPDALDFSTSDDYIGIQSRVTVDVANGELFYLSHDSIKELEKGLRGIIGDINCEIEAGGVFKVGGCELPILDCPDADWWSFFERLFDLEPSHNPSGKFAIDPTRISKANLLEPKSKFPLAFCQAELEGRPFWLFKYGPNTRGVISPLDEGKLAEVYEELSDVIW